MQRPEELFQRYLWLVNTLLSSGSGITFEVISNKWQRASVGDGRPLARATFNRWREAIEEMLGISIVCDKRLGAIYRISDPSMLQTNSIHSWMLRTLTVGGVLQNSLGLHERILLEEMPMGQEYLQTIIDAMMHGHTLRIDYAKAYRTTNTLEVEPYCLKVFRQRWYLLAHNMQYAADDLRVYALDRISCMQETTNSFRVPEAFDAAGYFQNDFGVYTGGATEVETIIIHAYGRLPDYLRSLPLHTSQQEVCTTPEYTEFRYRLRPTYDFRQALLAQADEVEVVSPESFRNEFTAVLRKALNRHSNQ